MTFCSAWKDNYTFEMRIYLFNIALLLFYPTILCELHAPCVNADWKNFEISDKALWQNPFSRFRKSKILLCLPRMRHRAIAGITRAYFTEEKSRYSPCHRGRIARDSRVAFACDAFFSRSQTLGLAASPKMHGRGRRSGEAMHPSTSIVDVCFHRISAVLFEVFNVCTYIHPEHSRIRTLRPSMTFLSLAALFPRRRGRRENVIPERHAKSFNDFFQRQFLLSR